MVVILITYYVDLGRAALTTFFFGFGFGASITGSTGCVIAVNA
jgi:hypothetical protein